MREIKFRAWDDDKSQMIYDFSKNYQIYTKDETNILFCGGEMDNGDWNEPILMQYTGLKDKKGKEIYEGDIILNPTATEPEDKGWLVFWKDYRWMIRMNDSQYQYEFDFNADFDTSKFEVIGNIYQNPELLTS